MVMEFVVSAVYPKRHVDRDHYVARLNNRS